MRITFAVIAVASTIALAANAAAATKAKEPAKSLYERLGGAPAVTAVVDDFVANVAADKTINHFFAKTDIPTFKKHLTEQLCAATGGGCTYTGKDMKTTHAGMGITNADWDALVGDLGKSLNKFKVKKADQKALVAVLVPLKPDIVEKK
jgi:hemoglobin